MRALHELCSFELLSAIGVEFKLHGRSCNSLPHKPDPAAVLFGVCNETVVLLGS